MSIYKKQNVIASYPAFDIAKREADSDGVINLCSDETIVTPEHLRTYKLGSVVSYALSCNKDPIAAYQRAIELKHNTHFINACGATITAQKREKRLHLEINFGDTYRFEGKLVKIAAAPNNNLKFVPQ